MLINLRFLKDSILTGKLFTLEKLEDLPRITFSILPLKPEHTLSATVVFSVKPTAIS